MAQAADFLTVIASDSRQARTLRRDASSWFASRRRRYLEFLIAWARQAPNETLATQWRHLVGAFERTESAEQNELRRQLAEVLLSRFTSAAPLDGSNGEAALFASPLAGWTSKARLRDALIAWTDERRHRLPPEELVRFVGTLPRRLEFFQTWSWRLFNVLYDAQIDPIPLGIVPDIETMRLVPATNRVRLWRHLEATSRDRELCDFVADLTAIDEDLTARQYQATALVRQHRIDEALDLITMVAASSPSVESQSESPRSAAEIHQAIEAIESAVICTAVVTEGVSAAAYARLTAILRRPEAPAFPLRAVRSRIGTPADSAAAHAALRPVEQFIEHCVPDPGLILLGLGLGKFAGRPSPSIDRRFEQAFLQRLDQGTLEPAELIATYDAIAAIRSDTQRLDWLELVHRHLYHARLTADLAQLLESSEPRRALDFAIAAIHLQVLRDRFDPTVGKRGIDLLRQLAAPSDMASHERLSSELLATFGESAALRVLLILDRVRSTENGGDSDTAPLTTELIGWLDRLPLTAPSLGFVLQVCRAALNDTEFRLTFAVIPRERLPKFTRLALAQTDIGVGEYDLAASTIDSVLSEAPDDVQALLLMARVLRAQHRNGTALEFCQRAMEIDVESLPGRIETLTVRRAVDKDLTEMIRLIDRWTESIDDPIERTRRRLPLLWSIVATRSAVAESLEWFRRCPDDEEAARHLARSLFFAGQLGAAEFFYGRVTSRALCMQEASLIEPIRRLRALFGGESLTEQEALSVAERINPSAVTTGAAPSNDSAETRRNRLESPEALIERACQLAVPRTDLTGPICLVTASLGHGGAERQVAYSAIGLRELAEQQREIVLVCPNLKSHRADFFLQDVQRRGVRVDCPSTDRGDSLRDEIVRETDPRRRRILELLDAWPQRHGRERIVTYFRAFERLKPSLAHTWQDKTNIHAGVAAVLAGVPRIVMSGRSLSPLRFPLDFEMDQTNYRNLLAHPGVTLSNNSQAGADDYARWLGIPASAIPVIHNGFDFDEIDRHLLSREPSELRRSLDIPAGALVLGTVGGMDEVKRPKLCLQVLTRVLERRPDTYAIMIGGGPMQQEIAELARQTTVAERFRFPGVLSPVEPWMVMLDLMLLTSRVEGLPNVLIEAQAVGTPVASTDVGGAAETFVDGETGILLRSDDPDSMAERIIELLARDDLPALRAAALAHARRTFSMSRMITRTSQVYALDRLRSADRPHELDEV